MTFTFIVPTLADATITPWVCLDTPLIHDWQTQGAELISRFNAFLGNQRCLEKLFQCHCDPFRKPKALARKLKLSCRGCSQS
jgi:hypothetical protein